MARAYSVPTHNPPPLHHTIILSFIYSLSVTLSIHSFPIVHYTIFSSAARRKAVFCHVVPCTFLSHFSIPLHFSSSCRSLVKMIPICNLSYWSLVSCIAIHSHQVSFHLFIHKVERWKEGSVTAYCRIVLCHLILLSCPVLCFPNLLLCTSFMSVCTTYCWIYSILLFLFYCFYSILYPLLYSLSTYSTLSYVFLILLSL